MKKILTKQLIEETHSNLTLVSSVFSLVVFTIILFIYNNTTNPAAIEFCSSLSISLSFLSFGAAVILAVLVFVKNNNFLTEYSSVLFILSAVFYILKGNTLTAYIGGTEKAVFAAAMVTALYWITALLHHCFLKEKMTPSKMGSIVILSVSFLILAGVIVLNYSLTPAFVF